jgi:hypothetical protein
MRPRPPALRRLVLARDPATGHLCLFAVPLSEADEHEGRVLSGFRCACGVVFDAICSVSSWTTEYETRCLAGFRPRASQ